MKIHGTAKGGALSKKDFGVAFGGAAPCDEETYNDLPDETLVGRVCGDGREGIAFRPNSGNDMYEKKIKSVTIKLDNDNRSPDEEISVRVRNSSGAIVGTFGVRSATTLTSSIVEYTFDSEEITLSAGDIITLEYPITSGDSIQTRVYAASETYVSNATTLASTTNDLTSWAAFGSGGTFYWMWIQCVYCA